MREVKAPPAPKQPLLERIIESVAPERAMRRMRARQVMAVAGQWNAARKDRRGTKNWSTATGSADADLLFDLPMMRERSRDMCRGNPLALGAINTVTTSAVGTGLSLNVQPEAGILGWSEDQAAAWAQQVESEFRAWAGNPQACDASKTQDFYSIQALAFRSALESGDIFALLPMVSDPRHIYQTRIHLIEADRIGNKSNVKDTDGLAGGVEMDRYGAPVNYHIMRSHPYGLSRTTTEWDVVPAFGKKSGRRNVIHLLDRRRPGQTRGFPYLAPVVEHLKQLSQYTEAEIAAAVVAGMFTVMVKTEGGQGLDIGADNQSAAGSDIKMGYGAIVDLAAGEDISTANPGRPNTAFDPFVQAILRQVGVALEIPFELLIKHFTASYSAARAALLEAWRFFKIKRAWLAGQFCQPIYEAWFEEAVALGRIDAPGFFDDPFLRSAYLGTEWIGDAPGQIDPYKEIQAARARIDADLSNHSIETMAIHGLQWEQTHRGLKRERDRQVADGTLQPVQPVNDAIAAGETP